MTKICTICHYEKTLDFFYKKKEGALGRQAECKDCNKKRVRDSYEKNREKRVAQKREYVKKNIDTVRERLRAYYAKNREIQLIKKKEYSIKNKDKIIKRCIDYEKKRMKDPVYRSIKNCRDRIRKICKGREIVKSKSKYLGCTSDFFRKYIEEKFHSGMSWSNYGSLWHIDHKKPISLFDLSNELERAHAFHYSNTQPMLAHENLKKSNKRIDV